jgi:tRNA 2-thiouridine synthesizing protein D
LLSYAILINGAPYLEQGAHTAYHFTKALLTKGHRIYRLFFYANGVHNGNFFITSAADELSLITGWQQLIEQYRLDMTVCVASANRRGVLDRTDAEKHEDAFGNLASCFKIGGLGQLVDAILHADRFIVFN